MTQSPVFEMNREFDAPLALVWKAWTTPDLVARWYGPGVETVIHRFEAKPGGLWLTEMRMSGGSGYQKAEFLEVEAPRRLVCLQSTTDEAWRPASNPAMPDWPRVLRLEVALEPIGENRTALRLLWSPHEASEAEIACFAQAIANLGKGWGMGMDALAALLPELGAA